MDYIALFVVFAVGLGFGAFVAFLWKKATAPLPLSSIDPAEHEKISRECSEYKIRLEETMRSFHKSENELKAEIENARQELKKEGENAHQRRDTLHGELVLAKQTIAAIEAEKKALDEQMKENRKEFEKREDDARIKFENLANRIFEEKTGKFKVDSEKSIGDLLKPLKEQIGEFQKKMHDSFTDQTKEQSTLKEQIRLFHEISEKSKVQVEGLTKALKGDSKVQGNWGEIILEKILEDSGLRKGIEYISQAAEMDLRNEEGKSQRPDVIVKLSDGKHIIIDSKVSLTHYEKYCAGETEEEKNASLKLFINSLRSHVNNLESKEYQKNSGINTPELVLMFVPIEGAYALAIQKDDDLHSFAWNKKVAIVCPSTLFATLRTIESMWKIERQNRNVQDIAERGGKLYDKLVSFLEGMAKLGNHLEKSSQLFDETVKKFSGRNGVISQAEKLKELGAKTSKSMPKEFIEEMAEIEEDTSVVKIAGVK